MKKGQKVLITGMGGSGKTVILKEIALSGCTTIDLDDTNLFSWINKKTGEKFKRRDISETLWLENYSWRCDIKGLKLLIKSYAGERVYIGGKVSKSQIKEISELFDIIFVLSPSNDVLRNRLIMRTNNTFAKSKTEQDKIINDKDKFENLLIDNFNAIKINADRSIKNIVSEILKI